MQDGWIKLWRKSMDSGLLQNHELWAFWCWCLLKASHKPHSQMVGYQVVDLKPGQFVFGRKKAAHELRLTERKIRTCLKHLEKLQNLTIKATNKYSIITIVNWSTYQDIDQQDDQQNDQQATSRRPAGDHKQECKNVKNDKNTTTTTTGGGSQNNTPYQKIIKIWNDAVVQNNSTIPQVTTINPNTNRQAHVRARYKDHQDIEIWEKLADKATRSDFLNGRTKARSRPFSFDWAVKSADNFAKILEGAYDNTDRHGGGPQKEDGGRTGSKYDKLKETVIYTDQK